MNFLLIPIVLIFLLFPGSVFAMSLEICNSGKDAFFIAHAEARRNSPYNSVGGWSRLAEGRCWRREAPKAELVSLLIVYVDAQNRIGVAPFNPDFKARGTFVFQKGPYRFCINRDDRFFRPRVHQSETVCPDGMVRVRFPFYLAERLPNSSASLKVAVDHGVLHEDHAVIPDPPERIPDPVQERYADPGEIDPIRGPSEYQIEAAEYLNLKIRLMVANAFVLKNGELTIRDLDLDRCLAAKSGLYYFRYRLDAHISAPEMQAVADLLNLGFFFKGYYWSSFHVANGRWRINKQYDGCRLRKEEIECWSPK